MIDDWMKDYEDATRGQLRTGWLAEHMLHAITKFREVTGSGDKFSVASLQVLFQIAALQHIGAGTDDLAAITGLSPSGLSRTLAALGRVNRSGEPGLGLIDGIRDLDSPRRMIYFLTDKGRETVTMVIAALVGRRPDDIPQFQSMSAHDYLDRWQPMPGPKGRSEPKN